ncbi:MAG: DUF4430 domain-containing protein [Symploca sp. SIO2D2]|nr:DUF4430 domain-containing protein [Symploca sp. SIO2D2]
MSTNIDTIGSEALAFVRRALLYFLTAIVVWFVNASVALADGAVIGDSGTDINVVISVRDLDMTELYSRHVDFWWIPGDTVGYFLRALRESDPDFTYTTTFEPDKCMGNFISGMMNVEAEEPECDGGDATFWKFYVDGSPAKCGIDTTFVHHGMLMDFVLVPYPNPNCRVGS